MEREALMDGLTLLRASRLEALVAPLQTLLQQTQPENLLQPQTVVAAHPGMKQWLTGALARHVGPGRIVANLEVRLPSAWLEALSQQLLGQRAVALSQYQRGHLRWTLHAMLGNPSAYGVTDPRLLAYLDGAFSDEEAALRRFQLADRLARVYSQYLVYRGDWLEAWEAEQYRFATSRTPDEALRALESQCLAPLWYAVVAQLGEHRGRLVAALVAALEHSSQPLPPLHLVGLAHLPPAELQVLRAYARRTSVFLYVPDPCREYWGGLHRTFAQGQNRVPDAAGWQGFRVDETTRLQDPEALNWCEQGHPLLARWGRLGQHFFAALADGDIREDIRHWQDEHIAPPVNRLQRLQDSIRQLEPDLLREDVAATEALHDASVRIHACHTRQRELEVLRDALLDALANGDEIRAGDIVVMAPDIQAYLPLIPAVFGEPGSARERLLPYHLADVPIASSHPLFAVFQTLLGMGTSRITAPEVVDLLGVEEIRRALSLDADSADTLVEWLRHSGVAWALDGAHKQALGLPARAEHSFAWAMDRMLAGYLMADPPGEQNPEAVQLPDGTVLLPLAGIEGPAAAALGSLDRLLCELQAWRALACCEQPASAWAQLLRTRVDALLCIDPFNHDARTALSVIHRAIAQLQTEPALNQQDPRLRLSVVRELLQEALAAVPERQRFLMGGITFCGMVPQRAIPFAMVCVLGLDEAAFPRRSADNGIDLMAKLRRLGDRDVAGDDRYLFLETVMSARQRLHLSYLGQGVRDGKHRNPAAPLAELMAELEHRAGIAPENGSAPRPWLVRHPLQPFDARYFDGNSPVLYSHSTVFAGMQGEGRAPLPRLRDGVSPVVDTFPNPLPLASLEGFYKDPAKSLLKGHLQLSLEALDDAERLPDCEPMENIAPLYTVARQVFFQTVLPSKCADPDWEWDAQPPAWVQHGGVLPLAEAGRLAWQAEAEAVLALWQQAAACARFDKRSQRGGQAVRVDVPLHMPGEDATTSEWSPRIAGIVRNVFPLQGTAEGVHLVCAFPKIKQYSGELKAPEALGFKELVPAFLQWATLRLQPATGPLMTPVRLTLLAAGEPVMATRINEWDRVYCASEPVAKMAMQVDLRRRLRALVAYWVRAREGRSYFYPKIGWEALQAAKTIGGEHAHEIADKVQSAWVKDFGGVGERDYSPGYARLLEGDLIFGDPERDPEQRALTSLLQDAREIYAAILLDEVVAPDADTHEEGA